MSDWDFLWGLTGDDLLFAQENGYTKEEYFLFFDDKSVPYNLYDEEPDFDDFDEAYIHEVTETISEMKIKPIKKYRCYADFEFNCTDKRHQNNNKLEIISVGMIICDEKNNVLEEFKSYVKPTKAPKLSDKCKGITEIHQNDIDSAKDLETVCQEMLQPLLKYNLKVLSVWGSHDKLVMYNDAKLHKKAGLQFESIEKVAKRIVDVQNTVTDIFQLPRNHSLKKMADIFEINNSKEHDALEDAKTLSQIIYIIHNEDKTSYDKLILFLAREWKKAKTQEIISIIGEENKEFAECVYQALNKTESKQEMHNFLMKNTSPPKKATELYKKIKPLLTDKN